MNTLKLSKKAKTNLYKLYKSDKYTNKELQEQYNISAYSFYKIIKIFEKK